MKNILFLLVLFYSSNTVANEQLRCSSSGIIDSFFSIVKIETTGNKKRVIASWLPREKINSDNYIRQCPILKDRIYDSDKKHPEYADYNGYIDYQLKLDTKILGNLLKKLETIIIDKDIYGEGEHAEYELKRKLAYRLENMLAEIGEMVRPCNFHGFYKTFFIVKETPATQNFEPPLPSYDGSSTKLIAFKLDTKTVKGFLKDCSVINRRHTTDKFTLNRSRLLKILSELQEFHKKEKFEGFGYLGGNWGAGDYLITSENELIDLIQVKFSSILNTILATSKNNK